MSRLESEVSRNCVESPLVVFDGPLGSSDLENAVGYIKTQHVQYLEPDQQQLLKRLAAGERTPMFRIDGHFACWSWYLRLPAPKSHSMSGIVRLELLAKGQFSEAVIERANRITATIGRYASEPHKDARAPQNLYPIAGLENHLRRMLGSQALLERGLRTNAAAS